MIIFLNHGNAEGQSIQSIIDSLKVELKEQKSDTSKAIIMAELSYRYFTVPDSQFVIANRGLELSKVLNYSRGIVANSISLATYQNNESKKLQLLEECLRNAKELNDKRLISRILFLIGTYYSERGDFTSGITYLKKVINQFQETTNKEDLVLTYNNIGYSYLKLSKFDSSKFFLQQGVNLSEKTKSIFSSYLYGSIAELFQEMGSMTMAKKYLVKAISAAALNSDINVQSDNYLQLAKISEKEGNDKLALSYTMTSISLAEQSRYFYRELEALKYAIYLLKEQSDYENALRYALRYISLNDSISTNSEKKEHAELLKKIDNLENEVQIKSLEKDAQQRAAELKLNDEIIKRQNFSIIGLAFLLLLLGVVFLLVIYNNRLKSRSHIDKHLYSELQASFNVLKPHFVFNALNTLQFKIVNAEADSLEFVSRLSQLIRRFFNQSFSPFVLLDEEVEMLKLYLTIESERFSNMFEWTISMSDDLKTTSKDFEIPPFIIQPFVENAIIHGLLPKGSRGKLLVSFSVDSDYLKCEVHDSGVGRGAPRFDRLKRDSKGIDLIMRRIELLNQIYKTQSSCQIDDLFDENGNASGTRVLILFDTIKDKVNIKKRLIATESK